MTVLRSELCEVLLRSETVIRHVADMLEKPPLNMVEVASIMRKHQADIEATRLRVQQGEALENDG